MDTKKKLQSSAVPGASRQIGLAAEKASAPGAQTAWAADKSGIDPKPAANPAQTTQSFYQQPSDSTNYNQNKPVYQQSEALQAAGQAVADAEGRKPEAYQGSYDAQIDGLINQLLNRQPFQYDPAADPLYQQYAQQYQRNGEIAMRDTLAQTAALTGGYGNSYAQQAGQQTYQRHLEDMNGVLPQLQQAAYQMYQDQGDALRGNLGMLQGMDESDYGRYRDTVGDWQSELGYLYGKLGDMTEQEYQRYLNDQQSWENDRAYWEQLAQHQADQDFAAQQFAYQQQQDQLNWDWLREQFEYQKEQDALNRRGRGGGGGSSSDNQYAAQDIGQLTGLTVDPVPGVVAGGLVANHMLNHNRSAAQQQSPYALKGATPGQAASFAVGSILRDAKKKWQPKQ